MLQVMCPLSIYRLSATPLHSLNCIKIVSHFVDYVSDIDILYLLSKSLPNSLTELYSDYFTLPFTCFILNYDHSFNVYAFHYQNNSNKL